MNHSGIISTSRGQRGIQNVYVWVCMCVCMREDYQSSELAARPALSLPSHFSLSSFLPSPYFPRGNLICRLPRRCSRLSTSFPPSASSLFWVTESTHQLLPLFVFQSTILTAVRNITVGSRQNRLLFFSPIATAGVTLFSLQCFHHCSVFSSAAPLFIIPFAVPLHPSLISLTVYL